MRFTIGKKLIGSFLLVFILFGAISDMFVYFINQVDKSYTKLISQQATLQAMAQDIQFTEVAEETAVGTQNISSATEEQLASMEEIASSASATSKLADELKTLMGNYRV